MYKHFMKGLITLGILVLIAGIFHVRANAQTDNFEDGVYRINSIIDKNMGLDVVGGSVSEGANVEIWAHNESNAQGFYIKRQSDGFYIITAECSGKALTAVSATSGANVELRNSEGKDTQKWQIIKNTDGTVTIELKTGNVFLDISGGIMNNGQNVQVWENSHSNAQKFTVQKVTEEQTLGDGVFTLASALNDSMRVDVSGGVYGDGKNVELWAGNCSNAQKFSVTYDGDGSYTLTSLCSDMNLEVSGGSASAGANVQQWSENGSNAQKWKIQSVGNGYYRLQAVCSGMYLDVSGANATNGANIQQWTEVSNGGQYFKFYQTSYEPVVSDGCYRLHSAVDSNYYVDINKGAEDWGANAQIWSSNDSNAQKFNVTYLGNGEYKIGCVCSALVLDVENGGTGNGTNVRQWPNNNTPAQKWRIYRADSGAFYFQSVASGKMLDVNGASAFDGNNVQIWEFNGSSAQKYWLDNTTPKFSGWTTLNQRKYYYNGNGELHSKLGIDVSNYQGDIDWQAVKNDGIEFAIIRVGIGDNEGDQDDARATYNMQECERLGIPYGVYLYSYADSDEHAYSEKDHILRMISGRNPQMGVYIDIEDTNTYSQDGKDPYSDESRANITRWTKIVMQAVADAGYTPGVYANKNYFDNILYTDQLSDIKWLAYYGRNNNPAEDYGCPDGPWRCWQYSSQGSVNGISGNVDMDTWMY